MELTTQCPRCHTRFTASVADLQRRKGFIRCVQCAYIFDGFEEVVPDSELDTGVAAQAPISVPERGTSEEHFDDEPFAIASVPVGDNDDEPHFIADVPVVVRANEPLHNATEPADEATLPRVIRSDRNDFIAARDESEPFIPLGIEQPPALEAEVESELSQLDDEAANLQDDRDTVQHDFAADVDEGQAEVPISFEVDERVVLTPEPSWCFSDEPMPQDQASSSSERFYVSDEPSVVASAHEYEDEVEPFTYAGKTDVGQHREPPHYAEDPSVGRRTLHWAGLLGLILLLLILALQLVYVFRNQVANQLPVVRPAVEAFCAQLGCEIAYERRIAQIKIVSSSLQLQGNGAAQNLYSLRVRLRNDSPRHQEWPTLVVTFTDISTAIISRIELPPERYLSPEQLSKPFGSFDELEFVLPVNSQGKRINGYKIDKYYS